MAPGDRWFFDRVARWYDVVMPAAAAEPLQAGLDLAARPVERVLDLGGGTGRASRALPGLETLVVDASPGMLARVPRRRNPTLASATALPVAEASVDAVLVVDAFHHLPAHDVVLAEAVRVLRPGGVLVVREFDRGTVRGRLVEAAEHAIRMESRFLTVHELRAALDAAGLEATVLEGGFSCTVVGRKPGEPAGRGGPA